MKKAIYFDMDGTIANLYGVSGWLAMLEAEDATPYAMAAPMLDMARLAKVLNNLHSKGYHIGIISWLSKNSTNNYDKAVITAKKFWLAKNIKTAFDEVKIVPYGTPKSNAVDFPAGILFDDEKPNRDNWHGTAYTPTEILQILEAL